MPRPFRLRPLRLGAIALALTGAIALGSCGGPEPDPADPNAAAPEETAPEETGPADPAPEPEAEASPVPAPDPAAPSPDAAESAPENAPEGTPEAIAVTVYTPDDNCEAFVPKPVEVAGDRPLEATVGEVLKATASVDFELQGYRVSVDPQTKTATVGLRLQPDARRQFASLSSCEQRVLFGSLNETLTRNPALGVERVEFFDDGENIRL